MDSPIIKTATSPLVEITSGKLLMRNTLWNLLGNILPLVFSLISIPLLIKALGTDRFGILSLAWVIIGYFGFFDLGLGRALTKMVAGELGSGNEERVPPLVWTTLLLMLLLGILGTLVLLVLSPWLSNGILKIPVELRVETRQSLVMLALSIPVVFLTSGLRGILEAKQCFGIINAVRVPFGVFMSLGPLLVIPFSHHLQPIILVLLVIRLLNMLIHLKLSLHIFPCLITNLNINREFIRPLISFGGWMTVSNVVGPLMVYADRFLISAFISIAAVAYYTSPYEVVTKLWIIPSALVGVLFPAFSASFASDISRAALLCKKSIKYIFIILFPITLLFMSFSYEGLMIWLGSEFAQNSFHILRWLAVGVFINSFAQVAFGLIQGAGRPDITAKFHLIQLPFYLVVVWLLIKAYGLEGAAVAWVLRISVDTMLLFFMSRRLLSGDNFKLFPYFTILFLSLVAFSLVCVVTSIIGKTIITSIILISFVFLLWFVILNQEEKKIFFNYARLGSLRVEAKS